MLEIVSIRFSGKQCIDRAIFKRNVRVCETIGERSKEEEQKQQLQYKTKPANERYKNT